MKWLNASNPILECVESKINAIYLLQMHEMHILTVEKGLIE